MLRFCVTDEGDAILPSFVLVPQGVATGSSCDKSVFEIKSATSAFGDVLWFHNVQQSATALTNIFFCVCVCQLA